MKWIIWEDMIFCPETGTNFILKKEARIIEYTDANGSVYRRDFESEEQAIQHFKKLAMVLDGVNV